MSKKTALILRDICKAVDYGYTASASSTPVGPRFLRITDIVPDRLDWGEVPFCAINPEKLDKYRLETGDIVIARTGATTGWAKLIKDPPEAVFASYLVRIKLEDSADSGFVGQVVQSKVYKEFIQQQMGGAAQPNANAQVLTSFPLQMPPLPTQRRIAAILSAYDDLIENNLRRIKILEEMARALYREWFVEFRFPGHEKVPRVASAIGPVPKDWSIKSIHEFGGVVTGKTPSKANATFYGEDMPFLKTPDMHGNIFVLSTSDRLSRAGFLSQANKTIPAGSLCVSCIGTIGVVCITTEDCQTNQQINSVLLTNEDSREFLFFRLQDSKAILENLGANGATMGNVNKSKFEAMGILTPTDNLLSQYHRLVGPVFSDILICLRRVQNLRRTRDHLLPRILSGDFPGARPAIAA